MFIAVIAHFISENNMLQITLIRLQYVISSYAGGIIAKQVISIIKKYEIEKG